MIGVCFGVIPSTYNHTPESPFAYRIDLSSERREVDSIEQHQNQDHSNGHNDGSHAARCLLHTRSERGCRGYQRSG